MCFAFCQPEHYYHQSHHHHGNKTMCWHAAGPKKVKTHSCTHLWSHRCNTQPYQPFSWLLRQPLYTSFLLWRTCRWNVVAPWWLRILPPARRAVAQRLPKHKYTMTLCWGFSFPHPYCAHHTGAQSGVVFFSFFPPTPLYAFISFVKMGGFKRWSGGLLFCIPLLVIAFYVSLTGCVYFIFLDPLVEWQSYTVSDQFQVFKNVVFS